MLMRTDPFREVERLFEQSARAPRSFPMDAVRRGDEMVMVFDLPGVSRESIDLTVERNVLTVRADRRPTFGADDELVISERPVGTYSRQVFLGDSLDSDAIEAHYEGGILTLKIPVAESAKPRKIDVGGAEEKTAIEAGGADRS